MSMIEEDAARLRKMNALWRDPVARREFEREHGLAPILTGNSLEVEAQTQAGLTLQYHTLFGDWARARSEQQG